MFKKLFLSLFLLAFLFLIPAKVFAVTVSVSNVPVSIGPDPFKINVTVTGASAGTNYLRVDLYKEGSTNYFGQTYNGQSFINVSDGTQYFPITIQSGTDWTGSVEAEVGNPTAGEYDGTGQYRLRIRRYTSSGNYNSSEANNGSVPISINFPTITPTPTKAPPPTKSPTAVPTADVSSSVSDSTYDSQYNNNSSISNSDSGEEGSVEGIESDTYLSSIPTEGTASSSDSLNSHPPSDSHTLKPSVDQKVLAASTGTFSFIFIALALIFFAVCGILAYFQFGDKILSWRKKS